MMALSRGLIGQVWAPSTRYKKRTNRLKAQTTEVAVPELALEVTSHGSIEEIGREAWDACNHGKGDGDNPFTSYDFLQSLEESGSAVASEGWRPCHFAARSRDSGNVVGVAPAYLKFHSWGEFVFDHSFAGAHARAKKGNYYPKLQCCIPFTPCSGPRLLVHPDEDESATTSVLAKGMMEHINRNRLSSAHVTFPLGKEVKQLRDMGWLTRLGVQYMWMNRGYGSFQDFESALLQRKRKSLRQERKRPTKEGLTVKRLRGDDIKAAHMDDFYSFYIDTTMRKFGMPYLTREFFHMLRERMADKVLLVMAEDSFGHSVAGALNLVGENAIFGRNWGMSPRSDSHKHLHFELCYYQAIEEAIEHGLDRVEAGAQGEHKIQRGYEPTFTHSAHFLRDEEFRQAIGQFVAREKEQMAAVKNFLFEESPYKPEYLPSLPTDSSDELETQQLAS